MAEKKKSYCGTRRGYQDHINKKETPCAACKRANTEHVKEVKAGKAKISAEDYRGALLEEPDVDPDLDRLIELRESLKHVRAAMKVSSPMHIAGLSKERREISKEIEELENPTNQIDEEDPLEALARMGQ